MKYENKITFFYAGNDIINFLPYFDKTYMSEEIIVLVTEVGI